MSGKDESKRKVNKPEPDTANAAALDERLQAHIGVQLKSMYDSYLSEPIPDRLVELLEKLDQVSKTDDPGGRGPDDRGEAGR
jgi:hypothetical protein